jgi:hypothetical protein
MKKYVYDNATVYITEPTEAQLKNIRKATAHFVHMLAKKGMLDNEQRRDNNRIGRTRSNARKRNK